MEGPRIDYRDFAEYDRRQRGIERHLVAAFAGGLAVGLAGVLVAGQGPGWAGQIFDPYVYLAVALVVGASASGFGWALLTTFLAVVSMLAAAIGASAFGGMAPFTVVGGSTAGFDWSTLAPIAVGLLAYVTRRDDLWGDLAGGAVGAALIAHVVNRVAPELDAGEQVFWPGPAVAVGLLTVVLVSALRRNARRRVRALAMSALFAGLITVGCAASVAGWVPLPA
ncbi:hypothetical protein ABGB18_26520 [Nonomuraea sp. B12E4]|uniref:hypothetical protein n=1 Tax=Nonomuraea sp. B12E4 TaxID=3153564 RepID=UPI00325E13B4